MKRDFYMLNVAHLAAVAIAALAGTALAQPQDESAEPEASFEARYGSLLTHNLFERERRPPRPETPPESEDRPPPPPPPPEKDYRLVGIVFEEGQFRAYFENTRTNRIERVAPGDAIATGVIGEVYIDAVSYLADGQIIWVDFGDDLTGTGAPAPARSAQSSESDDDEAEDGDSQSVVERLRQRRQAARNRDREEESPPREDRPDFDGPPPNFERGEDDDAGDEAEPDENEEDPQEDAGTDDPQNEDPNGDGGAR